MQTIQYSVWRQMETATGYASFELRPDRGCGYELEKDVTNNRVVFSNHNRSVGSRSETVTDRVLLAIYADATPTKQLADALFDAGLVPPGVIVEEWRADESGGWRPVTV